MLALTPDQIELRKHLLSVVIDSRDFTGIPKALDIISEANEYYLWVIGDTDDEIDFDVNMIMPGHGNTSEE